MYDWKVIRDLAKALAWAKRTLRDAHEAEVAWQAAREAQQAIDLAQTNRHECTNCSSRNCRWHLDVRVHNEAEDGRLRMHDVAPIAHLACEDCGEVIRTADQFEVNKMLN